MSVYCFLSIIYHLYTSSIYSFANFVQPRHLLRPPLWLCDPQRMMGTHGPMVALLRLIKTTLSAWKTCQFKTRNMSTRHFCHRDTRWRYMLPCVVFIPETPTTCEAAANRGRFRSFQEWWRWKKYMLHTNHSCLLGQMCSLSSKIKKPTSIDF